MSMMEQCFRCGDFTGKAGAGDDSIFDEFGYGPYCEPCFARKTLRDAAPDMYEALKSFCGFNWHDDPDKMAAWVVKMAAAIAKAEGREYS